MGEQGELLRLSTIHHPLSGPQPPLIARQNGFTASLTCLVPQMLTSSTKELSGTSTQWTSVRANSASGVGDHAGPGRRVDGKARPPVMGTAARDVDDIRELCLPTGRARSG